MKIGIFEVEEWERKALQGLAAEHETSFVAAPLTVQSVDHHADAETISTFIYSDMRREVLERLEHLELISTRSTGVDHIDLAYCRARGITVCNVPTYGEHTVAEHTFGLLLAISHKLVDAVDRTRRGNFFLQGLRGFDLRGKLLGVIGTGHIGRCVIEIARGFRMDVLAFDVISDEILASKLGFRYVDLDELLSAADMITLHVPANPKTHHLLSRAEFAKMKRGVVIVNTARGSVVDIQALVQALAEGKVAAAGLDVLPEEPVIREEAELLHALFKKEPNVEDLRVLHHRGRRTHPGDHGGQHARVCAGRTTECRPGAGTRVTKVRDRVSCGSVNGMAGRGGSAADGRRRGRGRCGASCSRRCPGRPGLGG